MLSIIIVNWNTKAMLVACLDSIFLNPPSCEFEVIVVDNASHDGSSKIIGENYPNVKLLSQNVNTGYAGGNNLGFQIAKGEWLLALNPDTEILSGTLDKAIKILENRSSYGVLAATLVGPEGEIQSSVRGFPTLKGIIGDIIGIGKKKPGSQWDSYRMTSFDYKIEQPAPQPMGTFLLFRREALNSICAESSPFDEDFPIFFNDVDLLLRLTQNGWPCLYTPKIQVLHHGGMSTKQVRKPMIWESHRSLMKYLLKHNLSGSALNQKMIRFGLILGAWIRARGYYERF